MAFQGASFRLCDLQVHTPRDANWDGPRPGEGLDAEARDEARAAWAAALVAYCEAQNIGAIAITDHHECVLGWEVVEAARGSDLWVFPGMEITAKDSAQALLLFDADIDRVQLERARSLLRLASDCRPDEPQGLQVELLDDNIADLQAVLAGDPELRDRFIILPNVTPGGHKTVMRNGFHKRFKELPYVGGYLDQVSPDELNGGDRRILEGQIPAWTSERRGVVRTSDCRSSTREGLGKLGTWVKLAAPTAEALRQAMLAADSRIRYEEPQKPTVVLQSLEIVGAEHLDDQTIFFSDQLNTVIGGRGAGKSTLLELIRFGLGRSALDEDREEWDPTHERRQELLEHAVGEDGRVVLTAQVDGATMVLTRTLDATGSIRLEIDDADQLLAPRDVRTLISSQVFSQGALSHLGRSEAEERLRGIITAPHRQFLDEVGAELANARADLAKQVVGLQEAWAASEELRVSRARMAALQARIDALRQSIGDQNESIQAALTEHETYLALGKLLDRTREAANTLSAPGVEAAASATELEGLAPPWREVPLDGAETAATELEGAARLMEEGRSLVEEKGREAEARLEPVLVEWREHLRAHQEAYEAATTAEQATRAKVGQLTQLQTQRAELQARIAALEEAAGRAKDAVTSFKAAWSDVSDWMAARRDALIAAAASVEPQSNRLATARLLSVGTTADVEAALTTLLEGTWTRENRISELATALAQHKDGRAAHGKMATELLAILKWSIQGGDEGQDKPDTPFLERHLESSLARLYERVTPERIVPILKADPHPRIAVAQQKADRTVDFSRASQGERATILLTLLMNQNAGPLIIDQPEEDLDNKVIGEIVAAVRTAKARRQMILATHNANLVVNGDAELVLTLEAGAQESVGAIDHDAVRDSITETMEGGRVAFELRRRKYNF